MSNPIAVVTCLRCPQKIKRWDGVKKQRNLCRDCIYVLSKEERAAYV